MGQYYKPILLGIKPNIVPQEGEQVYEASYKKTGCGELKWMVMAAKTEKEAREGMDAYMNEHHKDYRRYGGPMLKK